MADQRIRRGSTLTFTTEGMAGRNSPAWSVTYRIAGAGAKRSQAATFESGGWKAVFASSVTSELPPGVYAYEAELTNGTETYFVDSGRFELLPSLAHDDVRHADQSFAEQALAKIEEVLLEASESAEINFSVGDQSYSFESRSDLMAYRASLINQVERERRQREHGQPASNHFRFRLSRQRGVRGLRSLR